MFSKVTSSLFDMKSICRMFSMAPDKKKKTMTNLTDTNIDIYEIYGHKVPLETSKIKNTFGLKLMDVVIQFRHLKEMFIKTNTPLILKAVIASELIIFTYKNYIRKHVMLSKHYEKESFKSMEQNIIRSPIVKFFTKDSINQVIFDSLIYYFIGKSLYIINPKLFYKTIALGALGSILAYKSNQYSSKFFKEKYSINNLLIFPDHFNLLPNILLATASLNMYDTIIPDNTKYIMKIIPYDKKYFLGYVYMNLVGRISKFYSLFLNNSFNLSSTEGVASIFLALSLGNRRRYIIPFILTHYLNPYTLWIFVKTKNSMYQNELDKSFTKQSFSQKIKTLFKFTTLNSLSYMLNL